MPNLDLVSFTFVHCKDERLAELRYAAFSSGTTDSRIPSSDPVVHVTHTWLSHHISEFSQLLLAIVGELSGEKPFKQIAIFLLLTRCPCLRMWQANRICGSIKKSGFKCTVRSQTGTEATACFSAALFL